MGKRSTVTGYWREQGATSSSSSKLTGPSPRVMQSMLRVAFDGSVAVAAIPGLVLPAGCRVLAATADGQTTGTVDIGTAADPNGFAAALDTATNVPVTAGDLIGTLLAADTPVHAGDNTTGVADTVVYLTVVMDDDATERAN